MSSKTASHLIATAFVVLMLALGSTFGYFVLGGQPKAPADALTPDDPAACLLCGGGSGGSGEAPALFPDGPQRGGGGVR